MSSDEAEKKVASDDDGESGSGTGAAGSAAHVPLSPIPRYEFETDWEAEPFIEYLLTEIFQDVYKFSYDYIIGMTDILITVIRDIQVFSDAYTLSTPIIHDGFIWNNPYHYHLIDPDSTYIMFETHTMAKLGGMMGASFALSVAYGVSQIYKQYDFNKSTQPAYIHKKINHYRNQYQKNNKANLSEDEFSRNFLINGMAYVNAMSIDESKIQIKKEKIEDKSTSTSHSEDPHQKIIVIYNRYKNEKVTITFNVNPTPTTQSAPEVELKSQLPPKSPFEKIGIWIYGEKEWKKKLPDEKDQRGYRTGEILATFIWEEVFEAPPMWFWVFWYFLTIAGAAIPAMALSGALFLGPVGWALLGLMFLPAVFKLTGFLLNKYAPNFSEKVGNALRIFPVRPWNQLMFNIFNQLTGENKTGLLLSIKLFYQNKLKEIDEDPLPDEVIKKNKEQQEKIRMAGKFMFINELYAAKAKSLGFSVHQKINKFKDDDINQKFNTLTQGKSEKDKLKITDKYKNLRSKNILLDIVNGLFGFSRGFFGIQFAIAFAVFVFLAHAGIAIPPVAILVVGVVSLFAAAAFITKNVRESKEKQAKEIEMEDLDLDAIDKKNKINQKLGRMAKLEFINNDLKNKLKQLGVPALKMPQPEEDRCYRRLSEQSSTPWTWVKKIFNRLLPFVAKAQSGILIPRLLLLSGGLVSIFVAVSFPAFLGVAIGIGAVFALAGVYKYHQEHKRDEHKRLIQEADVRTHSLVHENELLENQMKCLAPKHSEESGSKLTIEQKNHNFALEKFNQKLSEYKSTINIYAVNGFEGAAQMQKIVTALEKDKKNSSFMILLRIQKIAKERVEMSSTSRDEKLQKFYTELAEKNLWQEYADAKYEWIGKTNNENITEKIKLVTDKPTAQTDLFKHSRFVPKTTDDLISAQEQKRKSELLSQEEPKVVNGKRH